MLRAATRPRHRYGSTPCGLPCATGLTTDDAVCQTLKERFAELLPEKIEEIKALRK